MDPTYPLVPVLNFLSAVLVLIPFMITRRLLSNVGITMLGMWILLLSTWQGVNAILWSNHAENIAPVWCNVASHLLFGMEVGIPASQMVITRQLYRIAHTQGVLPGGWQKVFSSSLSFETYHIVQGYRFDIYEEFGCYPVHAAGLSVLLVNSWAILFPIASMFLHSQVFRTFFQHYIHLSEFADDSNPVMRVQYVRILIQCSLHVILVLPLNVLILIIQIKRAPLATQSFYPGWEVAHRTWEPRSIPAIEWRQNYWDVLNFQLTQYLSISIAPVFFGLAGLTDEVVEKMERVFRTVVRRPRMRGPNSTKMSAFKVASRSTAHDL
ncbi:GPCR fungal pheromone mating factor [Amylostereum chailletii]|nr:GPCR fungal pheromone mating factor [Amylostereum chailletii]